jgi:hypothetical protein
MPDRRTSIRMAILDGGSALEIALQRRASIRLLLAEARSNGFDAATTEGGSRRDQCRDPAVASGNNVRRWAPSP